MSFVMNFNFVSNLFIIHCYLSSKQNERFTVNKRNMIHHPLDEDIYTFSFQHQIISKNKYSTRNMNIMR